MFHNEITVRVYVGGELYEQTTASLHNP